MANLGSRASDLINDIRSLNTQIASVKRDLDSYTTVKEYKDPAEKLVKAQSYYKKMLEERPNIVKSKLQEQINAKIRMKEKLDLEIKALEEKMETVELIDPEIARLESEINSYETKIKIAREEDRKSRPEIVKAGKLKDLEDKKASLEKELKDIENNEISLRINEREMQSKKDAYARAMSVRNSGQNFDTKDIEQADSFNPYNRSWWDTKDNKKEEDTSKMTMEEYEIYLLKKKALEEDARLLAEEKAKQKERARLEREQLLREAEENKRRNAQYRKEEEEAMAKKVKFKNEIVQL